RHRRRRIELRGSAEVPGRLVVVEPVQEGEALVEVLLGLRVLRRDRVVPAPHPGLDLGRRRGRPAGMVVLRPGAGSAEDERKGYRRSFHRSTPARTLSPVGSNERATERRRYFKEALFLLGGSGFP